MSLFIMDVPPLLFEQHPNPMLIFELDSLQILAVNKSALHKYGFSKNEFTNLTYDDLHPPKDLPLITKQIQKLANEDQTLDLGTLRHRTKRGETLFVEITTQPLSIEGRDAYIVHIHDITTSVQLKKQLEEASSDYFHHMEHNPLGMIKLDDHYRVIEWSKRAELKTGYSKNEVLGSTLFDNDFFDKKQVKYVKGRVSKLASAEKDHDRFETKIILKNGSEMDVVIHASALRNKDGGLKSVLAFIQNVSDHKEYQRQLEQRELKYHRLFEDANDGIFLMDGLSIIDCNHRVTEILGGSRKEIIGKTPLDFSPLYQPDGQKSAGKANKLIKMAYKGRPQVFEWRHISLQGKLLEVEVSLNRLDLGKNTYFQAILRDLSKQNQVERELEEERQRLKRAQELARLGWWSYDVNKDKVTWSDELYNILGVNIKNFESTFDEFFQMVHPSDRPRLKQVMELARQTAKPIDYMLRILKNNKDIIFAKCRAQSIFNDKNELIQLSGVLQDVTKQKKAQQELQRREELFETLFINSPVAVAMIANDGSVLRVNESFVKLFGYSQMELQGEDLLEHLLPDDRHDEIEGLYTEVFSNTANSRYHEDWRITKKGNKKHLLIGAIPVFIDDEPIAGFGIFTDITRIRAAEEHLQESLQEKEALLSEIHHRVKNNMAIVSGLMFLEELNFEEDTILNKVMTRCRMRIHSMSKIHEKLYQSGSLVKLNIKGFINEHVEDIVKSKDQDSNNIKLVVNCENITLNINQAVPCALIINELVINALEFAFESTSKGELEVSLKSNKDNIHIKVADDGLGLPDNFEELAAKSTSQQIIAQLVNQLNGHIEVETVKNKGTSIKVFFKKSNKSGSANSYFA